MKLTNKNELQKLHSKTIDILEKVGMKINEERMINVLKSKGCKVDESKKVVFFKPELVEETLEKIRNDIESGNLKQNLLNGPICSKKDGKLRAKFGGACMELFDFEKNEIRKATKRDIIDSIQLGEALPEVDKVGNTLMYLEEEGKEVEPRMQRIKTCEIVAKNTSKPGPTEVNNIKELDLQMEMGIVIRGSKEEFLKNPCFITAKETISPLRLENEAATMLLAFAERKLPCTLIPMPLTGVSVPMARESAIVIGNAEIIGTETAIRAVYPEAIVGGGTLTGNLNMQTGSVILANPEAVSQDQILAELYEEIYGQNFGVGVGAIDAKYPGLQAAIEKSIKILLAYQSGRTDYLVGMLASITRYSAEQAIIELEIAKFIHETYKEISIDDNSVPVDLIVKLGHGGNYLQEEHTFQNYKNNLWFSEIMDKTAISQNISEDKSKDILIKANEKVKSILEKTERYHLPEDKEKEINKIVKTAEKIL